MINTVYIAMYTPEAETPKCLGAYSTRKNAEDVLIEHYRKHCKSLYTQALTHIAEEHCQTICKKELEYYNTVSDYDLLMDMIHNDCFTIVTTVVNEKIETDIFPYG